MFLECSKLGFGSNMALGGGSWAGSKCPKNDGGGINVPFLVGCIVGSIGGLSFSVGGLLFFLHRRQRRKDRLDKAEAQRNNLTSSSPTPEAETAEEKSVGATVRSPGNSKFYVCSVFLDIT